METRANHIIVGSFVIAVIALTLASVLWLGKFGDDGNTAHFDILFAESVIGLSKGSMVSYNGVPVGEVESLAVDRQDLSRVLVRVRITGRDLVRADTVVTLGFAAITGVADIRLSGGSNESPRLYDPETVPVIIASPSPLAKLTASGQDIMVNLNEVAARLTDLLSEENVAHVRTVLGNVEALTNSLASERESLAMALHQLAQASSQVEGTLVVGVHSEDLGGNVVENGIHRTQHTLAAVAVAAITQLDSFESPRGRPGRDHGPTFSAVVEDDLHFHSRVAP